jgi:hypothetical protein
MIGQLFGQMATFAVVLFYSLVAMADEAAPTTIHCVVNSCTPQEDCRVPLDLGRYSINLDAGNEYIFLLTDNWTVTPDSIYLKNHRFSTEGYLSKTIINIDVNRLTNAFTLSSAHVGTGVRNTKVDSIGTCHVIKANPIIF